MKLTQILNDVTVNIPIFQSGCLGLKYNHKNLTLNALKKNLFKMNSKFVHINVHFEEAILFSITGLECLLMPQSSQSQEGMAT